MPWVSGVKSKSDSCPERGAESALGDVLSHPRTGGWGEKEAPLSSCWGEGVGFGAKQHVFESGNRSRGEVADLNFLL